MRLAYFNNIHERLSRCVLGCLQVESPFVTFRHSSFLHCTACHRTNVLELKYDFTEYPLLRHHMLQYRYHLVSISLYDLQKLLARHLALLI